MVLAEPAGLDLDDDHRSAGGRATDDDVELRRAHEAAVGEIDAQAVLAARPPRGIDRSPGTQPLGERGRVLDQPGPSVEVVVHPHEQLVVALGLERSLGDRERGHRHGDLTAVHVMVHQPVEHPTSNHGLAQPAVHGGRHQVGLARQHL